MVPSESQGKLALTRNACDVVGQALVHGRHRNRLTQLADVLVVLRCLGRERGDLSLQVRVVLDFPAELLQLRREPGLDQCSRALVDAGARLTSREGVREYLLSAAAAK